MADPLSVTASVIAVVGAIEGVSKTLAKVRTLRNAPSELLALINEASDLRIVLGDVERYITRDGNQSQAFRDQLQNISHLVTRAKDCLLELDKLIHYRFLKPGTDELKTKEIKVSRREWAQAKTTTERFRQSLRDIRLNLATEIIVLNS